MRKRFRLTKTKLINEEYKLYFNNKKPLLEYEEEEKEAFRSNFYWFTCKFWKDATGLEFDPHNIAIEAMCDHLQATYELKITNLIINAPIRHGKSYVTQVLFPPWVWINNPSLCFLYVSCSFDLVEKFSMYCKDFIKSKNFQRYFGDDVKLSPSLNRLKRFETIQKGVRLIKSFGSKITGNEGDFIIAEDPNEVTETNSTLRREKINEIYSGAISSRGKNPLTTRYIISQQRVNLNDLSGFVLRDDNYSKTLLRIPLEFESKNKCITKINGNVFWEDPRSEEKESSWPTRFTAEAIDKQKAMFGNDPYKISGQLQQNPIPAGGGLFKEEWFIPYTKKILPKFDFIVQSWDTALTIGEKACESACTTWGIFKENGIKNVMLLSLFNDKLEYPDLRRTAIHLTNDFTKTRYNDYMSEEEWLLNPFQTFKPDIVLVEAKVNGYALAQDLAATGIPIYRFNPNKYGHKEERANLITHLVEDGRVYLRMTYPHLNYPIYSSTLLKTTLSTFPKGLNKDIVDSTSQALIYLKERYYLHNTLDQHTIPQIPERNKYQYGGIA